MASVRLPALVAEGVGEEDIAVLLESGQAGLGQLASQSSSDEGLDLTEAGCSLSDGRQPWKSDGLEPQKCVEPATLECAADSSDAGSEGGLELGSEGAFDLEAGDPRAVDEGWDPTASSRRWFRRGAPAVRRARR